MDAERNITEENSGLVVVGYELTDEAITKIVDAYEKKHPDKFSSVYEKCFGADSSNVPGDEEILMAIKKENGDLPIAFSEGSSIHYYLGKKIIRNIVYWTIKLSAVNTYAESATTEINEMLVDLDLTLAELVSETNMLVIGEMYI